MVILASCAPLLAVSRLLVFDESLLLWSRTCEQRLPDLESVFVADEIASQVHLRDTLVVC